MDTPTTPPVLKRGATRSPSSRPAHPTFSPARPLTLAASTNPHEVLGSDNGMTGQSTGHGQYMPPWTPLYCLCTRLSHSTLPPSAFGNSQHQMSTPPVSPSHLPSRLAASAWQTFPFPSYVRRQATHRCPDRVCVVLSLRNVAQR